MILNLSTNHNLEIVSEKTTIAIENENKSENLIINIPTELASKWCYIEFETDDKQKYTTEQLAIVNNQVNYVIPNGLLKRGYLSIQVVLRDSEDWVWKSYILTVVVKHAINAGDQLAEEYPDFIGEAQEILEETQEALEQIEELIPTLVNDVKVDDISVVDENHVANIDLTGKQDKIDSSHKLDSDLVDDTNQSHKFVTSAMYDYLDNQLYQAPAVSVFQLGGTVDGTSNTNISGNYETGSTIIITGFRHKETNISNISGNLTFNGDSNIGPSATEVGVNLSTSLTITSNTTKTLSGTDTKGNPFSASKSVSFVNYAYSTLNSSTTAPTTGLTKQSVDSTFRTNGASFNYSVGDYLYLYTTSSSATTIQTNVLGQWADVNTTVEDPVTITKANGTTATYYCFRTTSAFSANGTAKYRVA